MSNQELRDNLIAERADVLEKQKQAKKDGNDELFKQMKAKYLALSSKISYYNSIENNPEFLKKKIESSERSRHKNKEDVRKYRQLVSIIGKSI